MRLPLLSMFVTSPFEGIQEHAEKIKECAWAFKKAIECFVSKDCQTFEAFRREVIVLENEADAIKRRIRGHLPKNTLLPVDKIHLFRYLSEQDHVLDSVKESLDWISFKSEADLPQELVEDFKELTDKVIKPIEQLNHMVEESRKYFNTFSEKQRELVKDIIRSIRQQEHDADKVEYRLKAKIFNMGIDPVMIFFLVSLVKIIGEIADHAENSGDMMRAMLAR